MTPLDASEVAKLLAEYGRRTALAGGNPYRSKAYLRAAESLAALAEPLARIVAEGRLREVPGIGDAIADIVTKLHRTGAHPSLDRMRSEIPEGVLEMLSVPGLRPDKVLKLYKERATKGCGMATRSSLPRRKLTFTKSWACNTSNRNCGRDAKRSSSRASMSSPSWWSCRTCKEFCTPYESIGWK